MTYEAVLCAEGAGQYAIALLGLGLADTEPQRNLLLPLMNPASPLFRPDTFKDTDRQ